MFTGIIEESGKVEAIQHGAHSLIMTIGAKSVTSDLKVGDSVNTNGVCLTVTSCGADHFTVDVMPETMRQTSLGMLKHGSMVNLERAVRPIDRLGGHIVSGHVDGTGRIIRRWVEDNATWLTISAEPAILRYIVDKGSVAVDGISLTVTGADTTSFSVSVIPHTMEVTTLVHRRTGDLVNIECDMIAKYIEKLQQKGSSGRKIDMEFLAGNDFL